MKTDRELVELAAHAIGWSVRSYSEHGTSIVNGGTAIVVAGDRCFGWRPHLDDGDSLNLAASLRFIIEETYPRHDSFSAPLGTIKVRRDPNEEPLHVEQYKDGEDRSAATRRAIVRAAAAIGEAK